MDYAFTYGICIPLNGSVFLVQFERTGLLVLKEQFERRNNNTTGFTMPPENKKAQKEVTGNPCQDTPKQAKLLIGEKLDTYLTLCKREFETTKDINENISTFRKCRLPHEDLIEAIFANRVATYKYSTGPARDDFIDTATLDIVANFDIEDENNDPTDLIERDTDTYFIDHHFEQSGGSFPTWSQAKPTIPQLEQSTPFHFEQSLPQQILSASQSKSSPHGRKNK
ncbi:hypothetical protein GIB67_039493 [Kingdonia uniflora]|uniref:Uncharacterized protein n=1 Tax=Kingdonia uniflora TaxID=39325 RepID=A0A7J7LIZ2_9MAGN|nr:hypothetical protein GIB67_039493 [Kingdonia uniflora]